MTTSRHPIWRDFVVVASVTASLISVLYFGWKVAGFPFVPFDAFDQLARALRGRVLAFGIGTMISVIRALNLGPTGETAKTAHLTVQTTSVWPVCNQVSAITPKTSTQRHTY